MHKNPGFCCNLHQNRRLYKPMAWKFSLQIVQTTQGSIAYQQQNLLYQSLFLLMKIIPTVCRRNNHWIFCDIEWHALDYDSAWILHSANLYKWCHTFTRHSLQRNTVCFNVEITFHFFPPWSFFEEFRWALDDICKYMSCVCGWFYDILSFYCGSVASEAPRIQAQ